MNTKKIERTQQFKPDLIETVNYSAQEKQLNLLEKLKIVSMEDVLHVNIKIKGLWKKNYSLVVKENRLMISALCRLRDEGNFKFITYTTSFLLPKNNSYCEKVWSDILHGELHVIVSKRVKEDDQQLFEKVKLEHLAETLGTVYKN